MAKDDGDVDMYRVVCPGACGKAAFGLWMSADRKHVGLQCVHCQTAFYLSGYEMPEKIEVVLRDAIAERTAGAPPQKGS